MDRHALDREIVSGSDAKTTALEEAPGSFTRLDEKVLDPCISRRSFQRGVDCRSDAQPDHIGPAVEMVDMPIRLQIAVADGFAVVVYRNQENPPWACRT